MEDELQLLDTAVEQSGEGSGNQPGRISRSPTTEKSSERPGNQPGGGRGWGKGGYLEFSLSRLLFQGSEDFEITNFDCS